MHRNSQLVIGLGLYLLSFSSLSGDEILMRDETELREYYKAISTIRTCFEEAISANMQNEESEDTLNGFSFSQQPNFESYRTSEGMFLEVWNKKNDSGENVQQVRALYTPFGRIPLLKGESHDQINNISTHFLKSMKWQLENVTSTVKRYKYKKDDSRTEPETELMESLEGCRINNIKSDRTVYRISSIGDFNCKAADENSHQYFAILQLTEEQLKKDEVLFTKLRGNEKCFHETTQATTFSCFSLLGRALQRLCSSSSPRHERLREEHKLL